MADADLGTGKIKLVTIHIVSVLTELKIYMERQVDNKALGSINWEFTDIKNICFLKTWGEQKERPESALDQPKRKALILH